MKFTHTKSGSQISFGLGETMTRYLPHICQDSNLGQGHILGQCPNILSSCSMMSQLHNDEILTPQMSGFKSGAGAHFGTVSQNPTLV